MRKEFGFVLVMALMVSLLTGCKAGTGTMLGTGLGAALGGVLPQVIGGDNPSPALQALAPIGGAVLGGAAGYMIDSSSAEEEEQKQALQQAQLQNQQRVQMQQQQMQQMQQTTRLSVPAVVVLGNNQAIPTRNNVELANVLIQLQPGSTFGMMTNKKNHKQLMADMSGNGCVAVGAPEKNGGNVIQKFQKPSAQAAPMSLDQAAKML